MPKTQTQDSWTVLQRHSSLYHLRPSVQRNAYKPQTGWLVLGALWLYYIVNFGTVLTLTAFPWLIETLKYTYYIYTISRLQSGESDTPSGHFSIFPCLNGYCEGIIGPPFHLSLKYVSLQSDIFLILSHHRYLQLCLSVVHIRSISFSSLSFSSSKHFSIQLRCPYRHVFHRE